MRAPLKTALASWAPSINIIIIIIIIIKLLLSFIIFICALYSYSLGFSMMLLHTQKTFYKKVWLIVRFFFSKGRFEFLMVMDCILLHFALQSFYNAISARKAWFR